MIHRLRGWVSTLVCFAALVGLFYVFQYGVGDNRVAPAKIPPCGSIIKPCAVHVTYNKQPATHSTIPTFKPPTLTPTTTQIVPLPPNTNCPSCVPQPSFAPAP